MGLLVSGIAFEPGLSPKLFRAKSAYGNRFRLTFHEPSKRAKSAVFQGRCANGVLKTEGPSS